ncbi:MAG: bifunctional folylpolyglutamate synthase/dihydrofolate synthase [Oscillospiraceae bacterium]|nr:bifunctional folylpolyglutamate synthase/dihydrofolate synthase [Oscillospiraceae bacterium]
MTFTEALDFIYSAEKYGSVLGLDTMRTLLNAMGNPQDSLKFVHVAGTNGKGSVCSAISTILCTAGYRTGLYISPFVQEFGERIQVNNRNISEEDLAEIVEFVAEKTDEIVAAGAHHPTVFELMTVAGLEYFRRQKCDIVVLEVGLGGRLDATNVIDPPECAVIMNIGLDHTDQLGNTIAQIAAEKGGIIKGGCPVVMYDQGDEAVNVIKQICRERGSKLKVATGATGPESVDIHGMTFSVPYFKHLHTVLLGRHQVKNLAAAVCAARVLAKRGWKITNKNIRDGIAATRWLGRFELMNEDPVFIVDGAHNPQAMDALIDTLELIFGDRKYTFIMGVMRDKDYFSNIRRLAPLASRFYTCEPPMPGRAMKPEELAEAIRTVYEGPVTPCPSVTEAVAAAVKEASKDDVIIACGSLYQIGDIRTYFGFAGANHTHQM